MSPEQVNLSAGRPLPPLAVALMLMLCLSWGFNQIAVKLALPDIPPMLQATLRSVGALPLLLLIARARGVKLFASDGTLRAGLFAGVLFGFEFVLVFVCISALVSSYCFMSFAAPLHCCPYRHHYRAHAAPMTGTPTE